MEASNSDSGKNSQESATPHHSFVQPTLLRRRAVLAAATLGTLAPPFARAGVSGTIRLGQSLPLTGPHSTLTKSYQESAVATFNEANSRRGPGDPQFELISLDDEGRLELTKSNTMRLAAIHGVHALFGYGGEGADRVGAMAAEAAGLPYVAPISGSVELRSSRRPGTFVFRASHADEIRCIARNAELIGLSRLGLVYEQTFLGLEMRNAMLELMTQKHRENIVFATIDTTGSNYTLPGALAAMLAGNPQAIVLGSNDVASAAFVKALRSAGYKGYIYALSAVGHGLADLLGPLVTGISVTQVVPVPGGDSRAVVLEHKAFCARNNIAPTFHSMEAWLGARLFILAMKTAGGTQPADIAKALVSAPEREFGGYTAKWYESKPNPYARVSLTVYDRDGRLRT